jgi:hypothetical protein
MFIPVSFLKASPLALRLLCSAASHNILSPTNATTVPAIDSTVPTAHNHGILDINHHAALAAHQIGFHIVI